MPEAGIQWFQVAARREVYWWMTGTRHVKWDLPEGFTASPGWYTNTGHVVDVAVIMQLELQQSLPNDSEMVPQSQFLHRVLDIPVACRDGCPQCKTVQNTVEIPQVQCLVVDDPEIMNRHVPPVLRLSRVQSVQKAIEIPQLRGYGRRCAHAATISSIFPEVPQTSSSTRS